MSYLRQTEGERAASLSRNIFSSGNEVLSEEKRLNIDPSRSRSQACCHLTNCE